jgi:capsular polysaccharide biosynthesis protein
VGFLFAKVTIDDTWKAQAVLIRHKKNMSSQTDMPYLYQELDFNTILQSVKIRKNLETVIDSLHLDTTPERLYGAIGVKKGNRSNLVNIEAINGKRQTAVDIANVISEVFIQSYVDILNSSTRKIYDYYLTQRDFYQKQVIQAENDLEAFRNKHKVLSLEKETQNRYDNLRNLELEMMNTELNITALRTKIAEIKERVVELPDKIELHSTVTASSQKQLKTMKNDLEMMLQKYTPQNPKVLKLQDEIAALEAALNEGAGELIPDQVTYGESELKKSLVLEQTQYENELSALEKKVEDYRSTIAGVKETLKTLSPLEREYYDIINRKQTQQNHLQKIENRLVEAKIAMESNVSDFEILERAVPPRYPEAAHRKMVAIVFGMLAFAGLFVFYAAKEFLDFSIKSEVDFTDILKIKLLGEIPNKDAVPPPVFYSQVQILYGQMRAMVPEQLPAILTVGRDTHGTGATFIIQEFIELLLSQRKKVLWIETLQDPDEEIADFIINDALYNATSFNEAAINVLTDQLHKAYFVGNEMTFKRVLDTMQLQMFYEQLHSYDFIIWEMFDVFYNLQLFNTIVSSSDLLMLVARFRHSNRNDLLRAVDYLKSNAKVPIVGVLNNVPKPYFREKY